VGAWTTATALRRSWRDYWRRKAFRLAERHAAGASVWCAGCGAARHPLDPGDEPGVHARPDATYSAADLQKLAKYPLADLCINGVCDAIGDANWSIDPKPLPGETKADRAARSKGDTNILAIQKFFDYPNKSERQNWSEWTRPLIRQMLTIDAASILIRKNRKGTIAEIPVDPGRHNRPLRGQWRLDAEAPVAGIRAALGRYAQAEPHDRSTAVQAPQYRVGADARAVNFTAAAPSRAWHRRLKSVRSA